MTDQPFRPDFRSNDDLPAGFNDLPEAERASLMAERVRLLHVYGQTHWHGELTIVGNHNALTVLRDAIDAALADGKATTTAMVTDGEGFGIEIEVDDRPWSHPAWEARELPYSDPGACGKPDPAWEIIQLGMALRAANAALVKRGAKPVAPPPSLLEQVSGEPS